MADLLERLKTALADRYEIESEIGRGGMATVYLAEDLKHNRQVAIKVLHPQIAATLGSDRFLREIQIAAGLEHPHILSLFDSGEADGFPFYVMPFIKGESLRDRLEREGALPIDDALKIAGDVANGLDYAHREGVIHRDIKPGNILLSEGHALIADFGIARALGAASKGEATATGLAVGTPKYMSPEQATGAGEIDGRADIYALGCVLWEMLVGEPLFDGPTPAAILAKKAASETPDVGAVRRSVPPKLDGVLAKATAPLAVDRFGTAAEMVDALESPERVKWRTPRRKVLRRLLDVGLAAALLAAGVWLTEIFRSTGPAESDSSTADAGDSVVGVTQDGSVQTAAISPDGRLLAYCTDPPWAAFGEAKLIVEAIDEPESVQLNRRLYSCGESIRWLSDGSAFVYGERLSGGNTGRLLIRRRPSGWEGLPREVPCGADFAISPDGTRCASAAKHTSAIVIASLEGDAASDTITIAADDKVLRVRQWISDDRLAFTTWSERVQTIWTVGLDGASQLPVMAFDAPYHRPVPWTMAHDGSAIYYVEARTLWRRTVTADGESDAKPELLTRHLGGAGDLSLSADGNRLLTTRTEEAGDARRLVWVTPDSWGDSATAEVAPVTDWMENLRDFSVSNNGEWVAYSTDEGVFKLRIEGDESKRLAVEGSTPVWSPDDRYVGFRVFEPGRLRISISRSDALSYPGLIEDSVEFIGFMLRWDNDGLLAATLEPPNIRVYENLRVWDTQQGGWQGLNSVSDPDLTRGVQADSRYLLPNDSVGLGARMLYPGPPGGGHLLGWHRTLDGSRYTDSTAHSGVWLVSSDGSEQTRFSAPGRVVGWHSDGESYYYMDEGSFYLSSLEGAERSLLLTMKSSGGECWHRPGTPMPEFVCMQRRQESDAWLIEDFDPHVD